MKRRPRYYSGTQTSAVTEREIINRKISRMAAAEGIVLMKNEGILPIKKEQKIALYGNGVARIIKGGTGSGDVNEREVVSLAEGFANAGIEMVNSELALAAPKKLKEEQLVWKDKVLGELAKITADSDMGFFKVLMENPFVPSETNPVDPKAAKTADLVVYIISRVAGEGSDRFDKEGDYYLSEKEQEELKELAACNDNIVVLINSGSQIDLKEIEANKSVKALLFISQGGMEIGNAVADVLTGAVVPNGKLTDTWSVNYSDFPNSATFSHNNGDVVNEKYEEGIYIGYRYFDSFGVKPAYPFGFGLSYTDFAITDPIITADGQKVTIEVTVTNTGSTYAGKEIVQVYAACPQKRIKKEFKRLVAFGKTEVLSPGQSQKLTMTAAAKAFASFDETTAEWVAEAGNYALLVGKSSADTFVAGILNVAEDAVIEKVDHKFPLKQELQEIVRPDAVIDALTAAWEKEAAEKEVPVIAFAPEAEIVLRHEADDIRKEARAIAETLNEDELIALLMGEISKGQDNLKDNELVATGIYVPGAAGETSCALEESHNIPAISMADGPAGLRVLRSYDVDRATGLIYSESLLGALDGGLLSVRTPKENVDTYYMYATAIPVGTLLAQTWNPQLIASVGRMIGGEMQEFGVSWWLAPGMNIHRNPLCGRNFEYYSEDPLVAGFIAAAMTNGVQSVEGVGTTIKHFACNNQEDNRKHSNSIVSERALREIYLKGFEIAIKTSQPMCIMTSYNLINDVYTCNNIDLCTDVARGEWDFQGIIMTDWTTTTPDCAQSYMCAAAGNDLIMPGLPTDITNIKAAFADGRLPREKAVACAARLINIIYQTLGVEGAPAYNKVLK